MIKTEIDTSELNAALTRLEGAVSTRRAMKGIGDIVVDGIAGKGGVFDNEGADGARWEQSKAAKKEGRKTLTKSGHLRRSIHRGETTSDSVVVGTTAVYGAIHHFGGDAGRDRSVSLPARPFMVIDKNTTERIVNFIDKEINKRR